ncbi:autotransporter domain-containing protein [Sutterella sp.]|uniref:autotransporter outer membrane beta-barrel domain-containing protein n=1 Tax=Sutterella sp. TaxID=1981025 RepID=UPI0026E0E430|nr:autotransporter domain-containing protein [Sutterella sp.]MDO5532825.1 autotransporter domain-containing protein [Sutterella sp.]
MTEEDRSKLLDELQDSMSDVYVKGAHIGTVGGSIALARTGGGATSESIANASSEIETVTLNLKGGYNAFTLAGGLSLAVDSSGNAGGSTSADGVKTSNIEASSDIGETVTNITGGDNVYVMGGGAAYATAKDGQNSLVYAVSTVDSATIKVSGGTTDGIYGGGLAIDDTNAGETNALASVETVNISVSAGEVNLGNVAPILQIAKDRAEDALETRAPTNSSYLWETATLLGDTQGAVAILGGGIATGAQANATVDTVTISLTGGDIAGNIFAGGAATLGGIAKVNKATIVVDGADIGGSIYGGGLAGSPNNDNYTNASYYSLAESTVSDVSITLASGTLDGNVYAGGFEYGNSSTKAETVVENAAIVISDSNVFQGQTIDGTGATSASLSITADRDFSVRSVADTTYSGNVNITGFNTIAFSGNISGVNYSSGGKNSTITGGTVDFGTFTVAEGSATQIGTSESVAYIGAQTLLRSGTDQSRTAAISVVNGAFGLASSDASASAVSALAQTGKTAVLYVSEAIDVSQILVKVGSFETEQTAEADIMTVADTQAETGIQVAGDGALVVDLSKNESDPVTIEGTVSMASDSILRFTGVGTSDFTNSLTLAQDPEGVTVQVDNVFWSYDYADGKYTFHQNTSAENAALGICDDVAGFYATLDASSGLRERVAGTSYKGSANLHAGMNLAAAAGVQMAAIQGSMLANEAAFGRTSVAQPYAEGITGYAKATGTRLEMGGSHEMNAVKADLGGVVVGADWTGGDVTAGALLSAGTGSVRGQDGNSGVKNEVDYWGVNAYVGKRFNTVSVAAQAGYVRTDNDLSDSSFTPAKADGVKADVYTVGIRAEVKLPVSEKAWIAPFVGVDYVRVSTDDYTVSNGTKVGGVDQNLWQVPVGIAFSGNLETASGWTWSPTADVAYLGSFGDRDVRAVTTSGSSVGSVTMDVWSKNQVRTRIGLEASKGAFSLGINAGVSVGSEDTRGISGQIYTRYTF